MKITNTHVFFWDGPFSQWYNSPFYEDGTLFPTKALDVVAHKLKGLD